MGGHYYILTIVDRYSHEVRCYLLKTKYASEIVKCFKQYFIDIGIHNDITKYPTHLMTDWGTEFKGEFEQFCFDKGIKMIKSCPYTAWQNGLCEI